jgi:hypothetical protein
VAVWGRWAVFAGTAPAADTNAFRAANGPFVATNKAYVLSVLDAQNIRMPETGSFEFKLANSEAWETQNGTLISRASVSGGRLSVNFGARSFSTALNVDVAGETVALSADGRITSAGALEGFLIYSKPGINMNVRGSLAGNTANQAAYIFDAPLSGSNRGVVGAASWGR